MIIVKKSGYLIFKNYKFKCALGKNGIKRKRQEGDNITPKGIFKLIKIYYRSDRIKNFKTNLKKIKIKPSVNQIKEEKHEFRPNNLNSSDFSNNNSTKRFSYDSENNNSSIKFIPLTNDQSNRF